MVSDIYMLPGYAVMGPNIFLKVWFDGKHWSSISKRGPIEGLISQSNLLKTLKNVVHDQSEAQKANQTLDHAQGLLGDHVTGGVIHSWRQVQKRLSEALPEGKQWLMTENV